MCNAHNHPPGCTCGWGGEGHLGSRAGASSAGGNLPFGVYTFQHFSIHEPNAICPVCGADVYFIRPSSGGAVFFDEVGPPWPKHPCMEHDNQSQVRAIGRARIVPEDELAKAPRDMPPRWAVEGWAPVEITHAQEIHGGSGGYILRGLENKHERIITTHFSEPAAIFKASHEGLTDEDLRGIVLGGYLDEALYTCLAPTRTHGPVYLSLSVKNGAGAKLSTINNRAHCMTLDCEIFDRIRILGYILTSDSGLFLSFSEQDEKRREIWVSDDVQCATFTSALGLRYPGPSERGFLKFDKPVLSFWAPSESRLILFLGDREVIEGRFEIVQ